VISASETQLLGRASNLAQSGKYSEAEILCRDLLAKNPDYPDALHLLGIVLGRLGKIAESVQSLRRALELQPNSAQVHHNLGFSLRLGCAPPSESIACFQRALQLNPNMADAFNNLGISIKELLKLEEAIGYFERAIQLNPNFVDAHANLGMALLTLGDFRRGLVEYDWRKKRLTSRPLGNFPQPPWMGEDPSGKTILLIPEQGRGDAIQFVRYVSLLQQRGAKIVLGSAPDTARLFERSFPEATVATVGSPNPAFESYCALVDLPLRIGTDLSSIPSANPYLIADPARVEIWKQKVGAPSDRLRVGLVWAGNPDHPNDRQRSIDPALLAPLGQVPNTEFYSLQKGRGARSGPGFKLIDFTPELRDFDETAALIENLDLVISVDTSVVHLAGALGKTTWILLPLVPDWRWLVNRSDSPWYPTVRLFRQTELGRWSDPVERAAAALRDLAK
jgi:hypothetical protein